MYLWQSLLLIFIYNIENFHPRHDVLCNISLNADRKELGSNLKTAFRANSKIAFSLNRQSIGGNTADLQANTSTQLLTRCYEAGLESTVVQGFFSRAQQMLLHGCPKPAQSCPKPASKVFQNPLPPRGMSKTRALLPPKNGFRRVVKGG